MASFRKQLLSLWKMLEDADRAVSAGDGLRISFLSAARARHALTLAARGVHCSTSAISS